MTYLDWILLIQFSMDIMNEEKRKIFTWLLTKGGSSVMERSST